MELANCLSSINGWDIVMIHPLSHMYLCGFGSLTDADHQRVSEMRAAGFSVQKICRFSWDLHTGVRFNLPNLPLMFEINLPSFASMMYVNFFFCVFRVNVPCISFILASLSNTAFSHLYILLHVSYFSLLSIPPFIFSLSFSLLQLYNFYISLTKPKGNSY